MIYPKLRMIKHRKLGFLSGRLLVILASLLVGLLSNFPNIAVARDMHGRIGLGYNGQFAATAQQNGVPAISVRYGLTSRIQIETVAGFYSGAGGSGVAALKFMQTIHPETYMNFYYLAGGGYVASSGRSGSEWLGGLGTEFFIPGIESVGFAFETGLSFENLTSTSFVLKTFGLSFFNVGMHFYF